MGNILSSCRAKGLPIDDQIAPISQTNTSSSQTEDVIQSIVPRDYRNAALRKYNQNFSKYYNHHRSRRDLAIYDSSSDSSSNFQIKNHLSKSFSSSDVCLAKNLTIKLEFNSKIFLFSEHVNFI